MIELKQSYLVSEKIMKQKATSFYQAFSHLPKKRFMGVTAIYAYCRYLDDTVDNDPFGLDKDNTITKLDKIEKKVKSIFKDKSNKLEKDLNNEEEIWEEENPWWISFVDSVKNFNIKLDPLLNQIKGQRWDIEFKDIETEKDLIEYGRLVAGSVGSMMLPLLLLNEEAKNNKEILIACENLGVGMQITNILRDVGEDLKTRNRVYLPKEIMNKFDITREELERLAIIEEKKLHKNEISKKFICMWEYLAQLADDYYFQYEKWLNFFHKSAQLPLVTAALSYRAIAQAVRDEEYNCFTKRCYTTKITRGEMILQAKKRIKELTK